MLSTILLSCFLTSAYAVDITFEWDEHTGADLDHYILSWGTSSANYTDHSENIPLGTTIYTVTALDDGQIYFFAVRAVDNQGLEGDFSDELFFAPAVIADTESGSESYTNETTVKVTLTAVPGNPVEIMLSEDDSFTGANWQAYEEEITFQLTPGDGVHSVYVRFRDANSNEIGWAKGEITLDTDTPLNPSVSSASPDINTETNDDTVDLSWSQGTDSGSGVSGYSWLVDQLPDTIPDEQLEADLPASITFNVGEGTYYIHVWTQDNAGNWANTYHYGPWQFDITAPNAPTVSGTTPTNDTTPVWTWSSGGGGSGTYRFQLNSQAANDWSVETTATLYTPDTPLSEGSHTLYVQERDAAGNWSTSGSFTVAIEINDPPSAQDASVGTDEDTSVDITLSATDPDGDTLAYVIVAPPSHGVLSGLAPDLTFTPFTDYYGVDSFTFKANDGILESDIGTVTITISAVNDIPVALNDAYSVDEGATLSVATINAVLQNDTDVENDPLTAILVSSPAHPSGTFSLNANGSFTYEHDGSESTSDSFTYQADDGVARSIIATVTITITPVNDAPTLNPIGAKTVDEGQLIEFTISATDPEGDNLTLSASDLPTGASFDPNSQTFSWTPNLGDAGNYDVLFSVTDDGTPPLGDSETVTITVREANSPPAAPRGFKIRTIS